ncbi:MAG: LysR family transcriptional regulator [Candidatus Nitronauta litoralis]|uniref:LysR family transcriptional regulator n=1 Tax=Candidatus Nitronauta litoralis TaxID=2705533 RepID=A0A7T0BWK3_9BACT|nr:MAG: LysR family transcriptional regulator [Candidatus Nitronauta litoralis]
MMPKSKTPGSQETVKCKARFRITVQGEIALGPGKIDLLEAIDSAGSISGAARERGLSYKRAWDMVATMNQCFKNPLVSREKGGAGGGGASLTELGREIILLYRDMEKKSQKATDKEWIAIKKQLKS